jgi:hypothetical protein
VNNQQTLSSFNQHRFTISIESQKQPRDDAIEPKKRKQQEEGKT